MRGYICMTVCVKDTRLFKCSHGKVAARKVTSGYMLFFLHSVEWVYSIVTQLEHDLWLLAAHTPWFRLTSVRVCVCICHKLLNNIFYTFHSPHFGWCFNFTNMCALLAVNLAPLDTEADCWPILSALFLIDVLFVVVTNVQKLIELRLRV